MTNSIYAPTTDTCIDCLQPVLLTTPGIQRVTANQRGTSLTIAYDEGQLSPERIQGLLDETQHTLSHQIRHEILTVSGIDCADCSVTLERGLHQLPGVVHVQVNFATARMSIGYIEAEYDQTRLVQRVQELGYGLANSEETHIDTSSQQVCCTSGACSQSEASSAGSLIMPQRATKEAAPLVSRLTYRIRQYAWLPTAIAALLWVIAFGLDLLVVPHQFSVILYALAIIIGGYRIARSGYYALTRSRSLDINVLMTIAVIGAAFLGDWSEGAAVVVLFALGETLEQLTMERVRRSMRALLDLSPREATLKTAAGEQRVLVEKLVPGQTIIIRPGERIAADGEILAGQSSVNQASITGESMPAEKQIGDTVYAGTLNEHGALEVQVTRYARDTTLARIIALVQEAQGSRAPLQRFIDRFARIYTPSVVVLALLVAILPPLLFSAPLMDWVYKALVLLVIACPCALVISTPVSIVAAIGRASRLGILIKGGAYLEALGTLRAVAFDKTGTITRGQPAVTDIVPLADYTASDVLAYAAAIESRSEHPLARAVLDAAREQGIVWQEPQNVRALPGSGAQGVVGSEELLIGKPELFTERLSSEDQKRIEHFQREGKTALVLGSERLIGIIAVADQIRSEATEAVARLQDAGISSVVMLTGDNEHTAMAVAGRVGISEVRANLLPEQKLAAVQQLDKQYGRVAMIGDGINDAPALAHATVGIAMGAAGNDTAMETADVALMTGDLTRLATVIRLSRATVQTIRANVIFSLVVKAIFLGLTIAGFTHLWLAILADTGTSLLVIANGMRLLRFKDKDDQ